MNKKSFIVLLIVLLIPLFANASVDVGARAMGMGGAFTAVSNDSCSIYWNPARLPLGKKNFSISIPSIGVSFTSNKSRDELEDLDGDELDALGSISAKVGVSALVGFAQNQWGIGGIVDLFGKVDFTGNGLDKIEEYIEIIEGSQSISTTSTTTASVNMTSEVTGYGGGVISYAHKLKGDDLIIGANLKILDGKVYRGTIGSAISIPANATISYYIQDPQYPTRFINDFCGGKTSCEVGYLDDMEGNGYAIDVAASKKIGRLGFLEDAYAGVIVRDLIGKLDVDGFRYTWKYSTPTAQLPVIDFGKVDVASETVKTEIAISPEIRAGISGRLPGSGILVAADLEIDTDDGEPGVHVGLEKSFGWLILRGGMGTDAIADKFSWAGGLGIHLGFLKLDLAYGDMSGGKESGKGAASLTMEF